LDPEDYIKKQLKGLNPEKRDIFLKGALSVVLGNLKNGCFKEKKMKKEIEDLRNICNEE
jgi:hypothetical protein